MREDDLKHAETADDAVVSQRLSIAEHQALSFAADKLDLWDWDLTSGVMVVSNRTARLLGLSAQEFAALGPSWQELIHPDDRPAVWEAINAHLAGRTPFFSAECRARHKSGRWVWVQSHGRVVERDETGLALRIMGFDMDVTERKSTESAIIAQKELALALSATSNLDQALELCVDTVHRIAGLDAAGIYLADDESNLVLVAHTGVSEEFVRACLFMPAIAPHVQAIFQGLPRYVHTRDAPPPMNAILEGESLQGAASIPITHGSTVIGSFYLASRSLPTIPVPIRPLLEAVASQVGGAITRILTESLLKESEERFRSFTEELPQIVYEIDTKGRFVFLNRAGYEFGGHQPEDLARGLSATDVIVPEDRERVRANMARILAGEKISPLEYEGFRKDGSRAPLVTYSSLVMKEGKVVGIRGLCVDVTPLKKAEARAKDALEEKELLLRELHHRVKNNLQVIQSLLRLQARHMRDDAFFKMVRETENRISAMALMHEQYCKSENLGDLNVSAYISRIIDYLVASYARPGTLITVDKEIQVIHLSIDTAMHVGLLLTELLIGCLKHPFPAGANGRIRIALRTVAKNQFELVVSGNGGPADGNAELNGEESVGLSLIDTLVRQVDGTTEIRRDNGTEFRILFRDMHRPRLGNLESVTC